MNTGAPSDGNDVKANPNAMEVAANCYARLQMPQFIETDVESWFYLLNFYFRAVGIAQDERKFDTVVSQLPPDRITEFRPIIDEAPQQDKYEYIKE